MHALKKEEGEGKRGENIKDCIFNFIFKRRGTIYRIFFLIQKEMKFYLKRSFLK